MNKVCQLKDAGVNIAHEECPKYLGWAFINKDTNQRIDFVGLNRLKTLISEHKIKADPRTKYLIGFVTGGHALAARDAINKLEKLKAFW